MKRKKSSKNASRMSINYVKKRIKERKEKKKKKWKKGKNKKI